MKANAHSKLITAGVLTNLVLPRIFKNTRRLSVRLSIVTKTGLGAGHGGWSQFGNPPSREREGVVSWMWCKKKTNVRTSIMITTILWLTIFLVTISTVANGEESLRSSVSDGFFHRQRDPSVKPSSNGGSPDVWSSGLRRSSTFFQKVCRCSRIFRQRQLVDVRPFEIAYVQSEEDCVVRCAVAGSDLRVSACASLNYCAYDKRCELFQFALDQPGYNGPGRCLFVNGCSYYSIDMPCVGISTSTLAPRPPSVVTNAPTNGPTQSSTTIIVINPTTVVVDQTTTLAEVVTTTVASANGGGGGGGGGGGDPGSTKTCPNGQNAAYSRTPAGFADARINIPNSQSQNIGSASDCQTECNKRTDCLSFDYLSTSRTCNFYNSINKDPLQPEANVEHYDSFCVSGSCSGTIDRVPQKVQFSSPVTESAPSAEECISKCLTNKPCLAVSYYPNVKKNNCLLSQQSRQTDPTSFLDETTLAKVDYYGLDACSSTAVRASARKSLLRSNQVAAAMKKPSSSHQPTVKVASRQPSSAAGHHMDAMQYREMVIARQKQKTGG